MKKIIKGILIVFVPFIIGLIMWAIFNKCSKPITPEPEDVVVVKTVVIHDTTTNHVEIVKDSLIPVKEIVYLDTNEFDTAAYLESFMTEREYRFHKSDSTYIFDQKLTLFKNEVTSNIFDISVISTNTFTEITKYQQFKYLLFVGGGVFVPFSGKADFSLSGSLVYKKNQFGIGYQFVNKGILIDYKYRIWSK